MTRMRSIFVGVPVVLAILVLGPAARAQVRVNMPAPPAAKGELVSAVTAVTTTAAPTVGEIALERYGHRRVAPRRSGRTFSAFAGGGFRISLSPYVFSGCYGYGYGYGYYGYGYGYGFYGCGPYWGGWCGPWAYGCSTVFTSGTRFGGTLSRPGFRRSIR